VAGSGVGCPKQRKGGADRRKGINLTSGPGRSVAEERGGGAGGCWAVMGRVRGVGPQRARKREARPSVEKGRGEEVGRCGLAGLEEGVGQ
jgi:hypothetical protein